MSFGVIVNERTAPPAQGAPTDTGTWFVTGKVASGPTDAPATTHSIQDFEASYGTRSTGNQDLYDAVDVAFREGANKVVVAGQTSGGDYGDGLALMDDWRLGPGQVSIIGAPVSADVATDLTTFCTNNNRVGVLDVNAADAYADMETTGQLVPANSDQLAMFGPWGIVPGAAGIVGGNDRQVPASAVIAGLCNRVDLDGNPNRAAAGRDYPLQYVTDFVLTPPTDTQRSALFYGRRQCLRQRLRRAGELRLPDQHRADRGDTVLAVQLRPHTDVAESAGEGGGIPLHVPQPRRRGPAGQFAEDRHRRDLPGALQRQRSLRCHAGGCLPHHRHHDHR